MEEDEPNQPVEPSSAAGQVEYGSVEQGSPLRRGALGCASAFLLTLIFIWIISTMPRSAFLMICSVLAAPAAGVFIWWWNRGSRLNFARGALVFGIVYSAIMGVCWLGSPHH